MTWLQVIFLGIICLSLPLPFFLFIRQYKTKKIPSTVSIKSVSYSPFSTGSPLKKSRPVSLQKVKSELSILTQYTSQIRLYSVSEMQKEIPGIATKLGIKVSLGIWIGNDEKKNQEEIKKAIEIIQENKNIIRVIVGNEVLFRHDVPLRKLQEYILQVKQAVDIPVTTAELWHIWMDTPHLADNVDELTIHILPYWENISSEKSIDFIKDAIRKVKNHFPGRNIYVGEIGWPSAGHSLNTLPCDMYQQAEHIRIISNYLNSEHIDYNVVEAFDQKWKSVEGTVGANWGLIKKNGKPKFVLTGKDTIANKSLAVFLFEFISSRSGKLSLALVFFSLFLVLAEGIIYLLDTQSEILSLLFITCWSLWFYTNSFISIRETLERFFIPSNISALPEMQDYSPNARKVSFHIACRNEPPEMVIKTLSKLSSLDYENYEVLVIDNNTSDELLWKPIENYCLTQGDKYKFWHVDNLKGFKGGALNFLLEKTDDKTDVIAVIDSDYQVESDWLKLTYFFSDPDIAVVQAPQNYRNRDYLFNQICYYEYKSFFNTGMIIRDSFNAIILHGTMTLIRASVLKELKWAEWCICEDAELGLRILQNNYKMKYIPVSYGQGLMPDNFHDYQKQRSRWAMGAMQIIRAHLSSLLPGGEKLSCQQRYQFIAGWMHWIIQPISILLTLILIGWTLIKLTYPDEKLSLPLAISVSLVSAFCMTLLTQFLLYIRYSPDKIRGAALSIIASQSLNYTIAKAVVCALLPGKKKFVITPKESNKKTRLFSSGSHVSEAIILLSLITLSTLTLYTCGFGLEYFLWSVMLFLRSIPFGFSIYLNYLSWNKNALYVENNIPAVEE